MKLGRAVVGGVAGALLLVLLLAAAKLLLGIATDVAALMGALARPQGGLAAWVMGAAAQLVVGAAVGVLYALAFEWVFRRAGVWVGLLVALPHVLVAGLAVGFLPLWMGAPPGALPGAFLAYGGAAAAACFVAAHLLFGAWMGAFYGTTRHHASPPSVVWRELPLPEGAEPGA